MIKTLSSAFLTLAIATGTAHADAVADCNQARDAQLRLRACSEIIAGSGYPASEKAFAYLNRGNARADAGAQRDALADLDEAIHLLPDDAAGYAGRATVRLALRDFDGATADYSEALRLAPGTASWHIGRGHVHFVRGDTTAAIADFTEAIQLKPNNASAYNHRGSPIVGRVICHRRWRITPLPLPSIPCRRWPTTIVAMSTKRNAGRMMPSRISRQRFSSIHR